jgi:shikimate kinase
VSSHLVLVGLMGSGKSTIGKPLAARLGLPYVDNDLALEQRMGENARELQAEHGADGLHRAEAGVLRDALGATAACVIAAAAAAVLEPGVRAALAGHPVVYLRAAPEVLAARVREADADYRPFGDRTPEDVLREQFEARDDTYLAIADLVVDATLPADELVGVITAALAQ